VNHIRIKNCAYGEWPDGSPGSWREVFPNGAVRRHLEIVVFEQFTSASIKVEETEIFVRYAGRGPALLLLHGFPQTHVMWRDVAPALTADFSVVCADLRGYGASGKPSSAPDHAPYTKRAMARDMVQMMKIIGFDRFSVAGHDRGGRVGYRLALDHADCLERLALLDIIPTCDTFDRADARFALAFWPWSLLAQPAPLPETLVAAAPDAVIDNALGEWGSDPSAFPADVREQYVNALRSPETAHAICEEYRAAATLDRAHDEVDRRAARVIKCPVLALWSEGGPLDVWYQDVGGPLGILKPWAPHVRGRPVRGGHFFPEQNPGETVTALRESMLEQREQAISSDRQTE
jgi:haloacetate dehalogenase